MGGIVGGVFGGLAGVMLLVFGVLWFMCVAIFACLCFLTFDGFAEDGGRGGT